MNRFWVAGICLTGVVALAGLHASLSGPESTTLFPGGVTLIPGTKQESDDFKAEPLKFYRFEYRVKSPAPGFVAAVWRNPDAIWGRDLQGRRGDLRAEDYQPVPASHDWQTLVFYSRAQFNAVAGCLRVQPIDGPMDVDSVRVTGPVAGADVLSWADSVSGGFGENAPAAGAGQAALLPRTTLTLHSGGRLRIVFLGDSIMQDAANSPVDLWLEELRPNVHVEIVTAIGGGAGMERWNHPEKFPQQDLNLRAAVIEQRPDLVLIGGISTNSIADTRQIIQRIRDGAKTAGAQAPDILLMTGAFGDFRKSSIGLDAGSLRVLAGEMHCAFFDLRAAWLNLLQHSHHDPDVFYRDPIHGSALGKQSQGRLIASWIASLAAFPAGPPSNQ